MLCIQEKLRNKKEIIRNNYASALYKYGEGAWPFVSTQDFRQQVFPPDFQVDVDVAEVVVDDVEGEGVVVFVFRRDVLVQVHNLKK